MISVHHEAGKIKSNLLCCEKSPVSPLFARQSPHATSEVFGDLGGLSTDADPFARQSPRATSEVFGDLGGLSQHVHPEGRCKTCPYKRGVIRNRIINMMAQ